MTTGAVVAICALAVTILINIGALASAWGGLKARLSYQDEKLENLEARSERTESLLAGLATRVEVRFASEAAARPRRNRKRS